LLSNHPSGYSYLLPVPGNNRLVRKVYMKKNSTRVLGAAAAAFLALGTLTATHAQAAEKYTLAFQGPLTGDAAQAGQDEIAGAKYALSIYNAANPNATVKLIEVDDQGSGSVAATVAPGTAANAAVIGVIGSAYSGASQNSFPSYKAAGLTMVSPSASRYTLTVPTAPDFGGPVVHRVLPNDSVQGPALARVATKGVATPKVYVVDDQSPYGAGLRDFTIPALKGLKATLVGKDSILPASGGGTDYSATVAKVKSSKANVVIYCGYDVDAGAFIKALRDGGYTRVFASGDGTATASFPTAAGLKAASGTRLTEGDNPFSSNATAAQKAAFTAAAGVKVAGGYVTNTINATNVFLQCISEGKTTRAAIATCVNTEKFKNFFGGTFSFDANGDLAKGSPVPISEYKVDAKGNIVFVGKA
jgi:branched-chain amino acid transport system substrate-binding protein